jgi:hypothetical protein
VIGAAYDTLGIAIERVFGHWCPTMFDRRLRPGRSRNEIVGIISGRRLLALYRRSHARARRADAVGAAGGRPLALTHRPSGPRSDVSAV